MPRIRVFRVVVSTKTNHTELFTVFFSPSRQMSSSGFKNGTALSRCKGAKFYFTSITIFSAVYIVFEVNYTCLPLVCMFHTHCRKYEAENTVRNTSMLQEYRARIH
jgi:hypothetical protein